MESIAHMVVAVVAVAPLFPLSRRAHEEHDGRLACAVHIGASAWYVSVLAVGLLELLPLFTVLPR